MPHEEMTDLEVRIRRTVLRRLLQGEPADLASLSTSTRLGPEEVAQALSKLNELGGIHVVDGALTAAYPLSGVPTRHRIRRDGVIIYANCAIDALAVPFMVDEIVRIESECAHCGGAIMMQMSGERIQAAHPGPSSCFTWRGSVVRLVPRFSLGAPTLTSFAAPITRTGGALTILGGWGTCSVCPRQSLGPVSDLRPRSVWSVARKAAMMPRSVRPRGR